MLTQQHSSVVFAQQVSSADFLSNTLNKLHLMLSWFKYPVVRNKTALTEWPTKIGVKAAMWLRKLLIKLERIYIPDNAMGSWHMWCIQQYHTVFLPHHSLINLSLPALLISLNPMSPPGPSNLLTRTFSPSHKTMTNFVVMPSSLPHPLSITPSLH